MVAYAQLASADAKEAKAQCDAFSGDFSKNPWLTEAGEPDKERPWEALGFSAHSIAASLIDLDDLPIRTNRPTEEMFDIQPSTLSRASPGSVESSHPAILPSAVGSLEMPVMSSEESAGGDQPETEAASKPEVTEVDVAELIGEFAASKPEVDITKYLAELDHLVKAASPRVSCIDLDDLPIADAKPEPQPEVKVEPQAEAEPQPQPESKVEPQAEAKPEPQSEAKVEPQAEANIEPQPEAKVEPQAEARPEPQPEVKAEPQAETGEAAKETEAEKPRDSSVAKLEKAKKRLAELEAKYGRLETMASKTPERVSKRSTSPKGSRVTKGSADSSLLSKMDMSLSRSNTASHKPSKSDTIVDGGIINSRRRKKAAFSEALAAGLWCHQKRSFLCQGQEIGQSQEKKESAGRPGRTC